MKFRIYRLDNGGVITIHRFQLRPQLWSHDRKMKQKIGDRALAIVQTDFLLHCTKFQISRANTEGGERCWNWKGTNEAGNHISL